MKKSCDDVFYVSKNLLIRLILFLTVFHAPALSQLPPIANVGLKLTTIEKDLALPDREKLQKVIELKKEFEKFQSNKDSVYAKILHRIGALQDRLEKTREAIQYTLQSIRISTSGRKDCSRKIAINSYFNLGLFNQKLYFYSNALDSYDSCIAIGNEYTDSATIDRIVKARIKKGNIYYQTGDYQKDVEEISIGLRTASLLNNNDNKADLLNERAQAYIAMKKIVEALADVQKAFLSIKQNDYQAYARNYKIRALIYEENNKYTQAADCFKKAINNRIKANNIEDLASDFNDAGNALREAGVYKEAKSYFNQSLKLSLKAGNRVIAAKASNNLGLISLTQYNYLKALTEYHVSLSQTVSDFKSNNELDNPGYKHCNVISDKKFLWLLLGNKTECLLYLYKQTRNKQYLSSALKTALLTDSLITDMRHEQTGEQSKLYWRNETREFFTNAIEACYQAADGRLAFYFMEKSRAVLLNDKLNELGASAYLPMQEAQKEQSMQMNVLSLQQQLSQLAKADPVFDEQQVRLLQAKEDFDNYIKGLREKYPAYWQYKYADDVPNRGVMQKYLKTNKQSFVHYFINDTIIYMLGITPSSSKFIKINTKQFDSELSDFLKICSDKQALNNHYDDFARLSHHIFNVLFKPLQLPAGRVIICYDNFLIPFEALTADGRGRDFLINNYTFSYVYSARFLLKNFNNPHGHGNFLGVAPVSYAGYLRVPQLMQSETSLDQSVSYFSNWKLITNGEANRANFLKLLPLYTIVTVLSHARADSSDEEPVLFMADTVIRLSELQLLHNPSTNLIVLSACQTNVGKMATGEGVISLARGFASAGIPCISATLWKADEKAIYSITENFLKNVSEGMRKDDALQKAKLAYMQNGDNESLLPFYWANMILAGNGDPVHLSRNNHIVGWLTGNFFIIILLLFFFFLRKKSAK